MSARASVVGVPGVEVELDGGPLGAPEAAALAAVQVREVLSTPAQCVLTLYEPARELAAGLGAELRVSLAGSAEPLFEGELTAIEYSHGPAREREVRLLAYDRLHRLRKRADVRAHVDASPAALARELAGPLGLAVEALADGPRARYLIQAGESHYDLLCGLAEAAGLYLCVRRGTLYLLSLEGFGRPVPLALGHNLLEARVELNADRACRRVTARGWDPQRAAAVTATAGSPRSGRTASAAADPERVGGSGELWLVGAPLSDAAEAEALAQGHHDRRSAGELVLRGLAEGDPELRAGTPVELGGLAPSLEGRYVISAVTHTLDRERGYLCELDTAPPAPRTDAARSGRGLAGSTALGIVTRVDDPDGLGRVRVSLPAFGEVETDWMEVVLPGAGSGKGLVALPDEGDRVLVLFASGDASRGLVLGGLYGEDNPPELASSGSSGKRYNLTTAKGQKIVLDDGGKSLRLENAAGSYVELAPGKVVLHSETKLVIEAPGSGITVRGSRIDFEKG